MSGHENPPAESTLPSLHSRFRDTVFMSGLLSVLMLFQPAPGAAARYSARRLNDIVRLEDSASQTVVSLIPSVGNIAFEMTVKGQNVLRWPYASIEAFKARPALSGIPFLGPWANRLDEQAFYANGKRYPFDMQLGNVRGAIPIHGFLSTTDQWRVVEAKADRQAAWVTSQLDFYRQPAWMKQFPFAHSIQITHRLENGVLEVAARIENLSAEPMPLAIGFHPYFQLTDSPRDDWRLSIGARSEWVLASNKIPTGETRAIDQLLPRPDDVELKAYDLDHVFGDLVRDGAGLATMTLRGRQQRLDVAMGKNYRAVVVYAPKATAASANEFVCFEPMAGITDALNLAHKGLYRELQSIPPGQTWLERFWIRPSGF
jgi:aldose 1-epimerase